MRTVTVPLAIVGTDTGVGKTVVTAGITRWLRENGADARAIKPVQTGCSPDDVDDSRSSARRAKLVGDAGFVAEACADPDAARCHRYLEPPLAPRVAAAQADENLTYESVRRACEKAAAEASLPIVEGIGGLRVPLAEDREVIDLVADLDATAIVVARSGLGTLNHSALSVEALERRGVDIAGIVCNEYAGASVAERTNPAELERMTGYDVETVPPLEGETPRALAAGAAAALSSSFLDRLAAKER